MQAGEQAGVIVVRNILNTAAQIALTLEQDGVSPAMAGRLVKVWRDAALRVAMIHHKEERDGLA